MKKLSTFLAAVVLVASIAGCGKTQTPVPESTAAATVAESDAAASTVASEAEPGEKESLVESTAEASAEESSAESAASEESDSLETKRYTEGMNKVNKLIEAYNVLLSQHKLVEDEIQNDVEQLTDNSFNLEVYTADGKNIQTKMGICGVAVNYYNNYVNNDTGYYDFETWISQQASNDELIKILNLPNGDTYDTNDLYLLEAAGVVCYLNQCNEINGLEVVETNEYEISGIISAYAIPLNCDGAQQLTAVFDENDNLINICSHDGFDQYLSSFNN